MVPVRPWIAPTLALAAVSALAFLAFRLYGRRVGGERAVYRLRRALVVWLPVVGIASLVALVVAGIDDAIAATLSRLGVGSEFVDDAANVALVAAGIVTAATAGYAGALPAALRVRDLDVPRRVALRRFVRWAGTLVGTLAVTLFAVGHLAPTGGSMVALAVVAGVAIYLAAPWLGRLGSATREPTDAERERIERLCGEVGFDPREVVVLDAEASRRPGVVIRGPPGRRTLFATDHLLRAYDDAAVRALLASSAARARRLHGEYRLAVWTGGVVAAFLALSAPPVALVGVAATFLALAWYGSRLVYAADEAAAEQVGRGAVAGTYRAVAEDAGADGGWGVGAFLRMHPAIGDRIERIEAGDN